MSISCEIEVSVGSYIDFLDLDKVELLDLDAMKGIMHRQE